jgi:hypothetical protein
MKFNCEICNKEFKRYGKQTKVAKYCSYKCMGKSLRALPNTECKECKKDFHLKKYRKDRVQNNFCSISCLAKWKSKNSFGEKNPNFRNKMYDSDGYRLIHSEKNGRENLHKSVVKEILNIENIPKGFHIHHRDCNHLNNDPDNLVLLKDSDHRWIHAQFGNATLWAFMNNKISLNHLISWSNDIEKAKKLLPLKVKDQIGVFKSDELRENPEVDNSEPSL